MDQYTESLLERVKELEIENRRLEERPTPTYDSYNMRFSRVDLLIMLAEMNVAKERERELDEQEEKRTPIEPAYHSVITLGSDAEIEINGEDITVVMPGPNGMKHCLEMDKASIEWIFRHIDSHWAKGVIEHKERDDFVHGRGSEWRYEIFDSNNVHSLLEPGTREISI